MNEHYILEGHTPVPADFSTWAARFEANDRQWTVALSRLPRDGQEPILVSTVFLGLDHSFETHVGHTPILFETMIFKLPSYSDKYCDRYATWDEAVRGHEKALKIAQEMFDLDQETATSH